MTKVLIAGTFDIIHPGHINFIKQAEAWGDFLIIIIGRDQNVIKAKGRAPYYNEEQRFKNLDDFLKSKTSKGYKLMLGDLNDPYKIIKEEKPEMVALGYDQQYHFNGLHQLLINSKLTFKIQRLEPFKEDVCKSKNLRNAVEDENAGFLLINKDGGWTSHDAVVKLRGLTGIRQIGHTGTLDPFATGLLICAISSATKMVGQFDLLSKVYEATIKIGITSDTYDRTGKINNYQPRANDPRPIFNQEKIQEILQTFIGRQKQLPPMFSAKKVLGQKLYELARKGQEILRKPSEIEIFSIELLNFNHQSSLIDLRIKCSTGTYIRSLAYDLGQKLDTGAVLWELKRTAIGEFNVKDAYNLDQITSDNWPKHLIKPLAAIEKINESYGRSVWQ